MKLLHSSICVASLQFIYFSFFCHHYNFFFLLLRRFSALQSCLILRYKIHSQSCYINFINVHIAYGFMDQICSQKKIYARCIRVMFKIRKRKNRNKTLTKLQTTRKWQQSIFITQSFFFTVPCIEYFQSNQLLLQIFSVYSVLRDCCQVYQIIFFLTFNLYVRPIDVPIDFFLYANQVEFKLRKLIAKKKTINVGWHGRFYLGNILIMGEN